MNYVSEVIETHCVLYLKHIIEAWNLSQLKLESFAKMRFIFSYILW